MSKDVIIIGAGGHAKVVADIVLESGDNIVGFLDDDESRQGQVFYRGCKIIGRLLDYSKYRNSSFVIAIGDNYVREKIANKIKVAWYVAIHPDAIVSETAKIGAGTVIMSGAVINSDVMIGEHCIINTGATVDHEDIIDNFVHISPGAHLAGNVVVGKYSWVGIGAIIINNMKIGENVILGAGAVVVRNIDKDGVYVGMPARKIR